MIADEDGRSRTPFGHRAAATVSENGYCGATRGGGANAMGHGGDAPTLVVVGARPEDEGVVAACKLDRGEGAGVARDA